MSPGWIKDVYSRRKLTVFKVLRDFGYERSQGEHTVNWEKDNKKIAVGPYHIWFFEKDDLGQWGFDSRLNFSDEDVIDYIKYFTK